MGQIKRVLFRLTLLGLSGVGIPISVLLSLKVGNPANCKLNINLYQLIMFAFLNSIILIWQIVKMLTGFQILSLPNFPKNTLDSMWRSMQHTDRLAALNSLDPLATPGFHYLLRSSVAIMMLNLIWLASMVSSQCSPNNFQEIFFWLLAGLLAAVALPLLIYSLIGLFKSKKQYEGESLSEFLTNKQGLTSTLKNGQMSLSSKLSTVLSLTLMQDRYVTFYLATIMQIFSWRINKDEIRKLETIRRINLRRCIVCETEFQCGQSVIMYPVQRANIGTLQKLRRGYRRTHQDEPDRLVKLKLKELNDNAKGIKQLIHPEPSKAILEMLDDAQVIWTRSTQENSQLERSLGQTFPKQLIIELQFCHSDCFCHVSLAVRTRDELHYDLSPTSYQSAFSWATSRMAELQLADQPVSAVPRFFGILDTPVYDRSKHLAEQGASPQLLEKSPQGDPGPQEYSNSDSSSD